MKILNHKVSSFFILLELMNCAAVAPCVAVIRALSLWGYTGSPIDHKIITLLRAVRKEP